MSILRARPRIVGRIQDTVIILLGVEEERILPAVKEARKLNNFVRPQTYPNFVY